MKKSIDLLVLLFLVFFSINAFACDVSYSSENGQIIVAGLTSSDNSKLFDANNNKLWGCDSWSSPCSTNEVISGLEVGSTYYLSVVSDICQEWIPIVVEGGDIPPTPTCNDGIQNQDETGIDCGGSNCSPCTTGCNIVVTNTPNSILINGLTADVNAKLFDADFNVLYQCDPWNGNPCSGDITIPNLSGGTYNLSAVSTLCNEWIPITIEEGGDISYCQTTLENWEDPACLTYNDDGSFTTKIILDDNNYIENIYSSSGQLINSNTLSYLTYGLTLLDDAVITGTNANGENINVIVEPSFFSTYTTGNNFFKPNVAQSENGHFYIIGVVIGDITTNQFGFLDAMLHFYVHQLDANGNEIDVYNYDSFLYKDYSSGPIGGISGILAGKIFIYEMLPLSDGSLDIFKFTGLSNGPSNSGGNLTRHTLDRISPSFDSHVTEISVFSNMYSVITGWSVSRNYACDLVEFYISQGGATGPLDDNMLFDYSVSPPRLVSQNLDRSFGGSAGRVNSVSTEMATGNILSVSFTTDFDGSNPIYNITITDSNGQIVFSDNNIDVVPDYLIPTGGNSFNYILNGVLYQRDCNCEDADNDGTCDLDDCQPNDPSFPTTPGNTCDDANAATNNDVIQSDGCTCLGETIIAGCNVEFTTTADGGVIINGLTSDANVKLFDANYGIAFECNPWYGNSCESTVTINNLVPGAYSLSVVSENCDEWIPINNMVSRFQKAIENTNIQITKVFPSPADQELFISYETNNEQLVSIQIFDATSRLQLENIYKAEAGLSTLLLDINSLNTGMHYLMISDERNNVHVKRFLKMD